jgi:hypothetical protein
VKHAASNAARLTGSSSIKISLKLRMSSSEEVAFMDGVLKHPAELFELSCRSGVDRDGSARTDCACFHRCSLIPSLSLRGARPGWLLQVVEAVI